MTKLMAQCVNRDNFFFLAFLNLFFFFSFKKLRHSNCRNTLTRKKKHTHTQKEEELSCGGPSEPAVKPFSSVRRARSFQKVIFLTFLKDTAYISLFMHSME